MVGLFCFFTSSHGNEISGVTKFFEFRIQRSVRNNLHLKRKPGLDNEQAGSKQGNIINPILDIKLHIKVNEN